MIFDLTKAIQNEGNKVTFEEEFEIEKSLISGANFVDDKIIIKGDYTFVSGEVSFNAFFSYQLASVCDRCLKPLKSKIDCEIHEKFTEDSNNGENYTFSGNRMDVTQAVNDSIMLSFPSKFLCSPNCKGLCFKCGQDLNEKECGCDRTVEPVKQNPFEVLKDD